MKVSHKKKLFFALVLIGISAGAGLYGWRYFSNKPSENQPSYETTSATKGDVRVSLTLDGKTVISRRDLSFEIGGTVRGVLVSEGDTVEAWDTLAYLDTREAQQNLELALREYSKDRNDFDEMVQVSYPGVPLTDTIDRILEKNQWDLEKAVLDVELKDLAKKKSYLVSPIAGTVAQVSVQPGETVSSQNQSVAVTIIDEDAFHFEVFAEDIEALKIEEGMQANIKLDALPEQSIQGAVSYVSRLATVDSNDLSTYKIILSFATSDLKLLDGMYGEAEIVSKQASNVIKIPNSAVKRENNQSLVYGVENGELTKIPVQLGFTNGKEVEVVSGITSGQILANWK